MDKMQMVTVAFAVLLLVSIFCGYKKWLNAVTVVHASTASGNEVSDHADHENHDTDIPDNQDAGQVDPISDPADAVEGGQNETVQVGAGETGSVDPVDQSFIDGVLAYFNFSYKVQMVTAVLAAACVGCLLTLIVTQWFIK